MAVSSEVASHRGVYTRLSRLDKRLAGAGVSAARRQALWARLHDDPMFTQVFRDSGSPDSLGTRIRADLDVCRGLRAEALAEDDRWVAGSVYGALLAFFYLTVDSDEFVFRGHLDADWPLIPSFFRMQPRASLQLHARMVYGAYRWAQSQIGEQLNLDAFGAEATAQHYGSGTTLLDTTESLRVAAYFATRNFHGPTPDAGEGAIYVLATKDLLMMGRGILRGRNLPPSLTRIHRTKGAFISGLNYTEADSTPISSASDIIEWMNREVLISQNDESGMGIWMDFLRHPHTETAVIRFKQTGVEFADDEWGVTRRHLGGAAGPPEG